MDNVPPLPESAKLQTGCYGKLPAHGDFISRQLPEGFIQPWDQWLQQSISASRELLGEQWLDTYLTSPIWHFALSPGLLDEHAWLGLMSPSVDSVGRYFSFCMALQLPEISSAIASFYHNTEWFLGLENLAIRALEERLDADSIEASLMRMQATAVACLPGSSSSYVALQNSASGDALLSAGVMLEYLAAEKHAPFSFWRTSGSRLVTPCISLNPGLPNAELFTSMMNSGWPPELE